MRDSHHSREEKQIKKLELWALIIVALALLLNCPVFSQDVDQLSPRVDRLFEKWNTSNSPGCAVAVIRENETIYQKCFGLATLEYSIPIIPSTVFHVASVSKQFTAFAVAMLAQEKRLSLDDDISKYLPELPDFGTPITIRHLIHHTSGLYEQSTMLKLSGVEVVDWISNEHVLKLVKHQKKLNFNPGDEIVYCNTGYTLLAEIVERVTGQSFREYAMEHVFGPLGMTHSHFHDDLQMVVKDIAYPYIIDDQGKFHKGILNYSTVGATGLMTTIEDMTRWIKYFTQTKVGSPIIEQMFVSGILNNGEETTYGYGLGVTEYKGLRYVLHSGHDAGYKSYLGYFPDHRFGIVILGNIGSIDGMELGKQIADICLEGEFGVTEVESQESQSDEDDSEPRKLFELEWERLWEFSGRFYSEELETRYLIIVRDSQLVATHVRNEDVILSAVEEDRFTGDQWWFRDVQYQRDEADDIVSFQLSAGRIRNVLFRRK